MIADGVLVACGAFGLSVFCFVAGVSAASSKRSGAKSFPLTHVSFDDSASDEVRLWLLDEARAALQDGRLSQANQLQNNSSTNQAAKPGSRLEQ